MRDDEEPRSDNRTRRTTAAATTRRRSARGWLRRRTVLRLEEIRVVRHRIDGDRLRALHRLDRRDDRILVRPILVRDGDVAVIACRDVDQLLRRIVAERVDA